MISKEIFDFIMNDKILGQADQNNLRTVFNDDNIFKKQFKNSEVIYSPDYDQKLVGIIIEGRATAEPINANEKVLLRVLSPMDMFGIANLYAPDQPFISVIVARGNCCVLFIKASAFCSLIEQDAGAMHAYLEFMSKKIIFLNKKISTLTAGSTEKKLALFLAENQHNGKFSQRISMMAIAETLSVGRASLYRALDFLESQGLIQRDGKEILIPDKNALLNIE